MSEPTQNEKSTQRLRIMQHLRQHGTITGLEALQLYGIMRLASRISELKKRGEPITKEMRTSVNKYGAPVHYAEYRLIEESDQKRRAIDKGGEYER